MKSTVALILAGIVLVILVGWYTGELQPLFELRWFGLFLVLLPFSLFLLFIPAWAGRRWWLRHQSRH